MFNTILNVVYILWVTQILCFSALLFTVTLEKITDCRLKFTDYEKTFTLKLSFKSKNCNRLTKCIDCCLINHNHNFENRIILYLSITKGFVNILAYKKLIHRWNLITLSGATLATSKNDRPTSVLNLKPCINIKKILFFTWNILFVIIS